jgi:putative flippase GtrA
MAQATTANSGLMNLLVRRPVVLQVLRFGAIGALNTALDFIILNCIAKFLGVEAGVNLGALSIISFSAAMVQSYYWNRGWAFASSIGSPLQNFVRLALVGGLGVAGFLAVFVGAAKGAPSIFFLFVLAVFIVVEIVYWLSFGLSLSKSGNSSQREFVAFIIVSLIGLIINSVAIIVVSNYLAGHPISAINPDSIKNIAKALATILSLIWNFLGYKLIVFKK